MLCPGSSSDGVHGPSFSKVFGHAAVLTRRQARWVEFLQTFKPGLVIEYRPSRINPADALSRRPDLMLSVITSLQIDGALRTQLKEAYGRDRNFQDDAMRDGRMQDCGGLWYLPQHGQLVLCIPDSDDLKHWALRECHDNPLGGHFGIAKTMDRLTRTFYWPSIARTARAYVRSCEACQTNKSSNQQKGGLLQPLPIPQRPWESVSMDFIVSLPKSLPDGFDCILVVVDRLTKMAHFLPTVTEVTAQGTANLFFSNIFRHHGLPKSLVTDRDSRFTSNFWRALFKACGTELAMSTAYHPQTDGQTERMNRTLEDALRAYVAPQQTDWPRHLIAIEVAYNDSKQASTNQSPFFLNYGIHPLMPHQLITQEPNQVPAADNYLERLESAIAAAREALTHAQQRQEMYANKERRDVQFTMGDLVRLSTENLKIDSSLTKKIGCTIYASIQSQKSDRTQCLQIGTASRAENPSNFPRFLIETIRGPRCNFHWQTAATTVAHFTRGW